MPTFVFTCRLTLAARYYIDVAVAGEYETYPRDNERRESRLFA
jgi:hypothetical protein